MIVALPAVSPLPPVPVIGSDTYFDEVLVWLAAQPGLRDQLNAWSSAVTSQATAAYGAGTGLTRATVSGALTVAVATGRTITLADVFGEFAPGQYVCLWCEAGQAAMFGEVAAYTPVSRKGVVAELTVDMFACQGDGESTGWVVFQIPRFGAASGSLGTLFPISPARAAAIVRDATGWFSVGIAPCWAIFAPDLIPPVELQCVRATAATRRAATGSLVTVPASELRVDFDRGGACLGMLVEESRTNLVPQSMTPADKVLSLSAGTYTVSVEGADTCSVEVYDDGVPVALLGTAQPGGWLSVTVATARTITLHPVGGVVAMQCEAGAFPTSHIPTAASATMRAPDLVTVPLAGVSFNATEGTLYASGRTAAGGPAAYQFLAQIDDGTSNNRVAVYRAPGRVLICAVVVGGAAQCALSLGVVPDATDFRIGFSWRAGAFAAVLDGRAEATDADGSVPGGLTTLRLGASSSAGAWGGTIRHLALFPRALGVLDLRAMTKEARCLDRYVS